MPNVLLFHWVTVFLSICTLIVFVAFLVRPNNQRAVGVGYFLAFTVDSFLASKGVSNYILFPGLLVLLILLPVGTLRAARFYMK